MKKILKVKGMHCSGCEMLIKLSLGELPGVKEVKASAKEGKVEVEYDESQVNLEKIQEVIKENGYEPEGVIE